MVFGKNNLRILFIEYNIDETKHMKPKSAWTLIQINVVNQNISTF